MCIGKATIKEHYTNHTDDGDGDADDDYVYDPAAAAAARSGCSG